MSRVIKRVDIREANNSVRYTYYDDGSTVCELDYEGYKTTGVAKLNPIDYYDPNVGLRISYGRALMKAAKKIVQAGKADALTIAAHKGLRKLNKK